MCRLLAHFQPNVQYHQIMHICISKCVLWSGSTPWCWNTAIQTYDFQNAHFVWNLICNNMWLIEYDVVCSMCHILCSIHFYLKNFMFDSLGCVIFCWFVIMSWNYYNCEQYILSEMMSMWGYVGNTSKSIFSIHLNRFEDGNSWHEDPHDWKCYFVACVICLVDFCAQI